MTACNSRSYFDNFHKLVDEYNNNYLSNNYQ